MCTVLLPPCVNPIAVYYYYYHHHHHYHLWLCSPARTMASSSTRFLDHTPQRSTVGRTPLDEWLIRRRDLYLTSHNTHNKHPCPGGIRTHDHSRRAAVELRFRPRVHWDRPLSLLSLIYSYVAVCRFCAVRYVIVICFYLLYSNYSTYFFYSFLSLFSISFILWFCIVLCIVHPLVYSCLFPISIQVRQPQPPAGNPVALNKFHITFSPESFGRKRQCRHNSLPFNAGIKSLRTTVPDVIFTGDFASWTVHFFNICVKNQQIHQLSIQFINHVW
jgi:hypothetical protein